MDVIVDKKPAWVQQLNLKNMTDKNFVKILYFFLFHTPCINLSAQGKSLYDYGWKSPWKKPYYLNRQLKEVTSNQKLIFSAKSYDLMEDVLEKAELKDVFPPEIPKEKICIYNNEDNQIMSSFYHIRNSLAHGRFAIIKYKKDIIYFFEDVQANKKNNTCKVSARIVMKQQTLLKWIEIIEKGEKEYSTIKKA